MQSLILASTDKDKRFEYIKEYCQKLNIDSIDITIIEKETALKQNVNSIGIGEVKNMQKKLFLKPIKSPTKAVVLEDAQLLTVEAQNSMLKILEEPPDNTIIILSSDARDSFLPTILSRCTIIELKDERQKLSERDFEDLAVFIEKLSVMSIGEKLKKAEQLAKEKQDAIKWIENMILAARQKILADYSGRLVQQIKILQKFHTLLKTTNVNTRFLLEMVLLEI